MNNALLSSPRRRWWATAGALAAAVAVGGTALGLQDSHAESPAAGAAPQGVPVSVAAVLQKDIALWDAIFQKVSCNDLKIIRQICL